MARVLIVDDEESIRTTIGAFAAKDGHSVSLASNATEALARLGDGPIDVVVTDIILPRKSGVALLAEIREAQPDVQVIMITGEPEVVTAIEAVRIGAFDYLSKPVSRETLSKALTRAAAKKALIDRNRILEEENRKYQEGLEEQVAARTSELQDSESRYRDLYDNAPTAYLSVGVDGRIMSCNRQAGLLAGLPREDLVGRPVTDLYADTPDGKAKALAGLARFRSGDSIEGEELQLLSADDSLRWVSVTVNAVKDADGRVVASRSVVTDITERKAAEEREARLLKQQTSINELALELGKVSDIDHIFETVYAQARALMDVRSFIVSFYDEDAKLLRAGYALFREQAFDVSKLPPIPLERKGHGTQSEVVHTGEALYLPDYRKTREKGSTEYSVEDGGSVTKGPPPEEAEEVTRSALFVPLKIEGKVIGVMQVQSYRLNGYTEEEMALLGGLANVTAVAIANSRLVQGIRDALEGTVHIISDTVEIRDPYTAGHQRRVAELSCAVGRTLGLSGTRLEGLRVASLLHDIGKMSVPAEILSKPTRLTEVESALIQGHPQVAHDLLKPIRFSWPVAEIVVQHHERMNGSGYPQGLKGDEILFEARILAVCDVVEAMASHRPYRPAFGIEAALGEIAGHRGNLYDGEVVDTCIALFTEKGFAFRE